MRTAISKWGNSLALRLPKSVAHDANLREGTPVDVRVEGDRLVVSPSRPKYRLVDLLRGTSSDQRHEEVDWGGQQGEEVW